MARRDRHPTDDERSLWGEVAKTMTPLNPKSKSKNRATMMEDIIAPPPVPVDDKPKKKRQPAPPKLPAALPPPKKTSLPELSTKGPIAGLDRRSQEKLRGGEMEIEARLDLHGMTLADAHPALRRFIHAGADAQRRVLLVITGKGRGAKGGEEKGVLRAELPHWLNASDLRPLILAFQPARPKHGGDGAFYVLLKRKR